MNFHKCNLPWVEYRCVQYNQNLTLQDTSAFMGLPPNSVGSEVDPGDLEVGALACEDLADAALSQRWRKRVTSSWSSIVFMCLRSIRQERFIKKTKKCI